MIIRNEDLANATRALLDWSRERALPFWAERGFDRARGRFEERLSMNGDLLPEAPVRLMVQGRQIFVYARAATLGWRGGAHDLVATAFHSMVRDFHAVDGAPGWVHSISREGRVVDARRDTYAHAFVLLAIASYVEATGDRKALTLADEILAFLDANASGGASGGYVDAIPPFDEMRRQNPHMHLFESMLALFEASGEERYLSRARGLFDLFVRAFYQSDAGALLEYFDRDLRPWRGEVGRVVEPGHHFEWIWLLRRFSRFSGVDSSPQVDGLYGHALRFGAGADGLPFDEVLIDGMPRLRSHRAWPVTEAIKAHVIEAEEGRAGACDRATMFSHMLSQRFLLDAPVAGWVDRLDEQGRGVSDFMPASTFYHVFCAIAELARAQAMSRAMGG
jgi:mannose-6-phosphate isomerase